MGKARKSILVIVLIAVLLAMVGGCGEDREKPEEEVDKKIEELMAQASEMLEEGDYDTVIDLYEEALELRDDEDIRKELERIKQTRP